MNERFRSGVVWREDDHRIDVSYVDGSTDRLVGSETVAAVLAADSGLVSVETSDRTRRWVRDQQRR